MTTGTTLEAGRDFFHRHNWTGVYAELSAADKESPLEPEDLERLATAAYLLGNDADSTDLWSRAHQEFQARRDLAGAARSALWLAFGMIARGHMAPAGGWLARAERVLENAGDCAEQGFLLALNAIPVMFGGDPATALAMFEKAAGIGDRFGDANVATVARMGQGDCRIRMGEAAPGMKLLDEVMVAVTAGEVSPLLSGLVYCALISACHATFDLQRAREWTEALNRWCDAQAGLVAYRGVCMVHRAEILQLKGAWPSAVEEVQQACERLSAPPGHGSVGVAFYVRGDLHRLRGEFAEADEAYRQASQLGRKPDPGLAQLRLVQGQVEAAAAAIRRVAEEAGDRRVRSRILPAYVEILIDAGDLAAARAGAEELAGIARELDSPFLRALSAQERGAVLLAEGDVAASLATLREAAAGWRDLEVPYEAARVHVLVGLACRRLGDEETAKLEFESARRTFQELGAAPDLARVEEIAKSAASFVSTPTIRGEPLALRPGVRLGPYEIIDSVGAGGMGEVFRARDTRLGRDVAVKILAAAHAGDPDSVRRFEKEARAVASLSHPNVVPLFDVGEQSGLRFAVSEYVEGETLRARLKRGALPPGEAAEIAAQIAEGLAAAHQKGFVHRDIKPENVILAHATFARILDFGLAKRSAAFPGLSVTEEGETESAFLTQPGIIAGTVGYMSPEQVRGEPVDGRSDIFSLGVTLWEMIAGHPPFRGESPVDTLSAILREEPPPDPALAGLSTAFERILHRCLEKRPEDRYQSAGELALDLRRIAADPASAARESRRRPGLGSALRTLFRPSTGSGRS